ncbi:MAG TPA: mechanosensitive ion channel family protein [Terriglobales bacterium]|nr:mechanosensitive ion channel family protein [Terriglobales bacterium]
MRVAFTIAIAFLVLELTYLLIGRLETWMSLAGRERPGTGQRARTLGQTMRNVAKTVVWAVVLIRVLDIFGWNIAPILAGAGIVGVALGFGAQTLVRDLIAGFFILIENQYGVGDWIEVSGAEAQVEEVTLRHTRLRNFNGYVLYVPNGELKTVTNRSRGWNRLTVDVPIGATEDVASALEVCRKAADGMSSDPHWRARMLEPIEVWGVESITGSGVQVRLVLRTPPGPEAEAAARELRLRCHEALAGAAAPARVAEPARSDPAAPRPSVIPTNPAPGPAPESNLREEHT